MTAARKRDRQCVCLRERGRESKSNMRKKGGDTKRITIEVENIENN